MNRFEELKAYWAENNIEPPKRRIVCAACKFGPVILAGARHFDIVMRTQIDAIGGTKELRAKYGHEEQGFIDQFGCYLSREDALAIAKANKQPLDMNRNGSQSELFSEGLY